MIDHEMMHKICENWNGNIFIIEYFKQMTPPNK